MKILVVEDEQELLDSIVAYLKSEGFVCEQATNYQQGSLKTQVYNYDCYIIDLGLPDGNGLTLIKDLKLANPEAAIIIISARNSLDDKLAGLGIGADDYLTKPFHLQELNARIKSLIRRRQFQGTREIRFNEIRIVPDTFEVFLHQQPVSLTKKEYDLLLYFLANRNRIIAKETIAEHLWGDYVDNADSFDFVYTHIKNLRKKMLEKGCRDYIQTVYGVGYKFTNP